MSTVAERSAAPATERTRRCEAVSNATDTRCGNTAFSEYFKICEHEHLERKWVCPGHVASVVSGVCSNCREHPTHPHRCSITLVPTGAA